MDGSFPKDFKKSIGDAEHATVVKAEKKICKKLFTKFSDNDLITKSFSDKDNGTSLISFNII